MKRAVAPLAGTMAAILVTGVVLVTMKDDAGLGEGEAHLFPRGVVEAQIGGAPFARVTEPTLLHRGDRVRVADGHAILELPRAARAELRRATVVRVGGPRGSALTLEAGDLLAEARRTAAVIAGGPAIAAVKGGSAKLTRSASLVAGTYEGTIVLRGSGRALEVPRFRQAAAAGRGLLPTGVAPLELRPDDEWDRRLLGGVLELDRQLLSYARGFEAQLPPASATSAALFSRLVPALRSEPVTPEALSGRSAGENLIGLVMVSLEPGDFAARMARVFGFREEGARWGLVAADRGLAGDLILALVRQALAFIGRLLPPVPETVLPPGPGAGGGNTGTTTPTETPPPDPAPPVELPPVEVPPETPPVELPETGTALDPIVDLAQDTVGGLIQAVLGGTDALAP